MKSRRVVGSTSRDHPEALGRDVRDFDTAEAADVSSRHSGRGREFVHLGVVSGLVLGGRHSSGREQDTEFVHDFFTEAVKGGTLGDDLVRVAALHRDLGEQLLEHLLHAVLGLRHLGRTADEQDAVDLFHTLFLIGEREGLLREGNGVLEQVAGEFVELLAGHFDERSVALVGHAAP